jgi:DNA-damage-inducible protein D
MQLTIFAGIIFIRYNHHMSKENSSIILFNQKQVRRHWDAEKELWYFSVVDVIEILTDSSIPRRYWSDLKNKLKNE